MREGITSNQIARRLKVSTQTIRNWTDRYPIEVEVEEESGKRIYDQNAMKQLAKINYLKENVDELIRKEIIAERPSYLQMKQEKEDLEEEIRKWKRSNENLLMNNEILRGKKRELEEELSKKNQQLIRYDQDKKKLEEKLEQLGEFCGSLREEVRLYQDRWGREQDKPMFAIIKDRFINLFYRTFYRLN